MRCDFNRQGLSNELSNSKNGHVGGIAPYFGNRTYGTKKGKEKKPVYAHTAGGISFCGRVCVDVMVMAEYHQIVQPEFSPVGCYTRNATKVCQSLVTTKLGELLCDF